MSIKNWSRLKQYDPYVIYSLTSVSQKKSIPNHQFRNKLKQLSDIAEYFFIIFIIILLYARHSTASEKKNKWTAKRIKKRFLIYKFLISIYKAT